jgi:hypothetical protein
MNGMHPELRGMIMRPPDIDPQRRNLRQVGALGVRPGWGKTFPSFFAWYSKKTPGPLVGFLGGNALRQFQVEIDYVSGATYWKRESAPDRTIWIRSGS